MAEITTTTAGFGIAAFAAAVLEITGVSMQPIVWALIGAAFGQAYSNVLVGRWRAMIQVTLGGMIGSLIGLGAAYWFSTEHPHAVLLLCALGGAGAHPLVKTAISRGSKQIQEM